MLPDSLYCHSGKLGDIIYSVPAFRLSKREAFGLIDQGHWGTAPLPLSAVAPLFEAVGIRTVMGHGGGVVRRRPGWINASLFRSQTGRVVDPFGPRDINIAEKHLLALGVPLTHVLPPWLSVEPSRVFRWAFARSARYRPAICRVDWARLVRLAGREAVFVGLREEYRDFCRDFGVRLPYFPTSDLLDLACLLSGADVVCSNQTCIAAVAHGLGKDICLETCERIDDCRFGRRNESFTSDHFISRLRLRGVIPCDDNLPVECT